MNNNDDNNNNNNNNNNNDKNYPPPWGRYLINQAKSVFTPLEIFNDPPFAQCLI